MMLYLHNYTDLVFKMLWWSKNQVFQNNTLYNKIFQIHVIHLISYLAVIEFFYL